MEVGKILRIARRGGGASASVCALSRYIRRNRSTPRLREAGSSPLTEGVSALELLRRPEVDWKLAAELTDSALDPELGEKIANELKYEGYIARQQKQVEKFRRMELLKIPASIDYAQIRGLSAEGRRQALEKFRPATLGQASRIPGVPPLRHPAALGSDRERAP